MAEQITLPVVLFQKQNALLENLIQRVETVDQTMSLLLKRFEQAMSNEQSYFWTAEWQAAEAEAEAEEDLRLGRYDTFETGEALLADFMTIARTIPLHSS